MMIYQFNDISLEYLLNILPIAPLIWFNITFDIMIIILHSQHYIVLNIFIKV